MINYELLWAIFGYKKGYVFFVVINLLIFLFISVSVWFEFTGLL